MSLLSRLRSSALLFVTASALSAAVSVDAQLPDYHPVSSGVSGTIKSEGSDTMNNMMALWGEGFRRFYPNVQIEIQGKGSSTAPPALIQGTATFGPMSRKMKDKEMDTFVEAFGYKAVQLPTSIDMLAVYVNKDNPIKGMTLKQVDGIFSKTRKSGSEDIIKWKQLGLSGSFATARISIFGRNPASGTYGYFKKHALKKGDYRDSVKEQPGSSAVVQGVAKDMYAIGYSGIGYKTANVRAIALGKTAKTLFEAKPENAYSGDYPLARFLYLSVNFKPGSQLDPLRAEFIKYVLSKQGQAEVVKDGYLPVSAAVAQYALEMVKTNSR